MIFFIPAESLISTSSILCRYACVRVLFSLSSRVWSCIGELWCEKKLAVVVKSIEWFRFSPRAWAALGNVAWETSGERASREGSCAAKWGRMVPPWREHDLGRCCNSAMEGGCCSWSWNSCRLWFVFYAAVVNSACFFGNLRLLRCSVDTLFRLILF